MGKGCRANGTPIRARHTVYQPDQSSTVASGHGGVGASAAWIT
jgi:hypothetical protein